MDYFSVSERGSRKVNEDSIGVFQNNQLSCFIVADGLGGHGKGDVASRIVVENAGRMITDKPESAAFFERFFSDCEKLLSDEQDKQHAPDGIKTTAVIAVTEGASVQVAHIGDSRFYFFRSNRVLFRTLDHSVPQILVAAGELKERKIRNHPDRNRLLKVLGAREHSSGEKRYDEKIIENVHEGDAMLLCSDGFWELIYEREMCRTLKKASNAEEWCNAMRKTVEKRGAERDMDNYSAICVWF